MHLSKSWNLWDTILDWNVTQNWKLWDLSVFQSTHQCPLETGRGIWSRHNHLMRDLLLMQIFRSSDQIQHHLWWRMLGMCQDFQTKQLSVDSPQPLLPASIPTLLPIPVINCNRSKWETEGSNSHVPWKVPNRGPWDLHKWWCKTTKWRKTWWW